MKREIRRILACVIASAMFFSNFAGTGAAIVKAAVSEDDLCVKAVDGEGNPEKGVSLMLDSEDGEYFDIVFDEPTDANGEVLIEAITDEAMGDYFLKPAEDSGYTSSDVIKVSFEQSGILVNGYSNQGKVVEIHVESTGGGQPSKARIDSVESSVQEADRDGQNAVITVKGANLPQKLSYQIWYRTKVGGENTAGGIKSAAASGSDTVRQIQVSLPDASAYPDAVQWIVKVIEIENPKLSDSWTPVSINIKEDILTEETKAALQSAIDGMAALKESDYTVKSWKVYSGAVETARLLLTKQDATNTECKTAVKAIEKAKAALILVKDLAAAQTKAALKTAVEEAEKLNGTDYTEDSWKAYRKTIDTAKLLLADENAMEVQCQTALKEIEKTKAALTIKTILVSKITISGVSKKIAAGKKIRLTAEVSPANASNKALKWETSNKKYAAVDAKGNVTVKKAGAGKTVAITAAALDGSGQKAVYKIQIQKNAVKSIKLKASKTVKAGKSLKVKATVKATGKRANKKLKWTSSNSKYAAVSSKGIVKAKKAGKGKKVKITAAATDGSGKKKAVTIKIK